MRYSLDLALTGLRLRHKRAHGLLVRDFVGWLRVEFLGTAATVVVLGVGGQRVLAGDLGIGVLAAFLLYLRSLFDPVGPTQRCQAQRCQGTRCRETR